MAEPLKNSFGPEVVRYVAESMAAVSPGFDVEGFSAHCVDGYEDLELTPRARRIADGLARHLPEDRVEALRIIVESLDEPIADPDELGGMESFRYLPYVYFVAEQGLDHPDEALDAQYELTQRFTAEFSIRTYLEHHTDLTLDRLRTWARDDDVHVRRLVSEGTRPRLPWAPRLRNFQDDPSPVLELLELLRDDPEEYVRRSVANNLNDIAKDHPDLVVEVARRWWDGAGEERRRLVRHGLRTLIKAGDPGALDVIGYGESSPVELVAVTVEPSEVAIGAKVKVAVELANPADEEAGALVDLRVHFVKANGSTSPKVFKGAEPVIAPGGTTVVRKTVSLAVHSTRTPYPGTHTVEVLMNGAVHDGASFEVTEATG
ncbi:MAG: DNA alkylation repair protein [Actinomycetota bacterium]